MNPQENLKSSKLKPINNSQSFHLTSTHNINKIPNRFAPKQQQSLIPQTFKAISIRRMATHTWYFGGAVEINHHQRYILPPHLQRSQEENVTKFKRLSQASKASNNVRSLSISCSRWRSLSYQRLRGLRETMKRFTLLESFTGLFQDCPNMTEVGIEILGKALEQKTSLKKLELNFSKCPITEKWLSVFSKSLKRLPDLQDLNLSFESCQKITNKDLTKFSKSLGKNTSLQRLKLNFSNISAIGDEGFSGLCKGLKKLTALKGLHLAFYNCNKLTLKAIDSLSETLRSLPLLQSLHANLSGFLMSMNNDDEDESDEEKDNESPSLDNQTIQIDPASLTAFSNFGEALETLTSLKKLSLGLSTWEEEIYEPGLSALTKSIGKLDGLQSLSLSLGACANLVQPALTNLANNLSSLVSLQNFSLSLEELSRLIDDAGFLSLRDCFANFLSLKTLNISFNRCKSAVTDQGLLYLSEGFKNLKSLENLTLDFMQCKNISHDGVLTLSEGLRNLQSLKEVKISCGKCFELTEEEEEDLLQKVQDILSSVEDLTLNL